MSASHLPPSVRPSPHPVHADSAPPPAPPPPSISAAAAAAASAPAHVLRTPRPAAARLPIPVWAGLLPAGIAGFLLPLLACGPFFPNSLLNDGDRGVLQAPQVRFRAELARLQLPAPPGLPHVVPTTQESDRAFTLATEISDLRRVLFARGADATTVARVVLEFSRLRANLEEHRSEVESWLIAQARKRQRHGADPAEAPAPDPLEPPDSAGKTLASAPPAAPTLAPWEAPNGLPREFELYLRGAVAWHEYRTNDARAAWSELLALPPAQRPAKSTWATYMLGRSWHEEAPAKAMSYYEQTRKLARTGWNDSLGLGSASLGWEAQARLHTNDLAHALRLYLDQYASGETNGTAISLSLTIDRILAAPPAQRLAIARDPVFRRVITARALADQAWSSSWNVEGQPDTGQRHAGWLETIESVGAAEVPLAEQLALLSYQMGDWTNATRWIELSADSPVASWVRAKLLLREGKLDEAASQLARVVDRFPLEPEPLPRNAPADFVDSLYASDGEFADIPGRRQALGELGVVRLTRGDFTQSLDALLRAGFWQDAAYVAERVLALDELKAYVDAHWPAGKAASPEETDVELPRPWTPRTQTELQRTEIRHLLARRLMRVNRITDARAYFPPKLQADQSRLHAWLSAGQGAELPPRERAQALFHAASLLRTNGLELIGTELAPDYAIWEGQYDFGSGSQERIATTHRVVRPTTLERKRAAEPAADPDLRFHYRYHAASLAWDAAKLLPDNNPETATILYRAGGWLKARDPKTADVFYKALVRRCRKTELGDAADRQRWFPELDESGHPVVTRKPALPTTPPETAPEEPPDPPLLPEAPLDLNLPPLDPIDPLSP